jgi:hypothetical protein
LGHKGAGFLCGDVNAVCRRYTYRRAVGCFAALPAAGAGAVYHPGQPSQPRFVRHYAFGQRAAANVAEANHKYFQALFFIDPQR